MSDFLSKLNSDDLCGVLCVAGGLVFGITAVIASIWFKLRKAEIAATLKQDMLNRGMSADEIKTVIEASPKK
jgi:hypothetical protein